MASVTKNGEKSMSDDEARDEEHEHEQKQPEHKPSAPREAEKSRFFTIYKKGQGYWTRLCTAGGVLLVLIFFLAFLYREVGAWWITPYVEPASKARKIIIGLCATALVGFALLAWRILNKADNVDFLIATDSEMKKVNWTSQRELIGSTKVVIFFMIMIAAILFLIDVIFGYFFYVITVLKARPF
jgi:preprotein translocase SecE subunit